MKRQEELLTEGGSGDDGRAKGASATGDGRQAAVSLTPDTDGMLSCIFDSLQLEVHM